MSRVSRIVVGLVVLVPVAAAAWWWWPPPPARPGIVVITIDTLRADRVGAYGSLVRTPALDRLAAEGVRFDAAYAPVPLTLPSHVSMFSGRLPVEHTVRTNDGYRVPDGVPLAAEALRRAGYRTAAFVGSAVLRSSTGIGRGFERFDDEMGNGAERRGADVVARAVEWLDGVGDAPFFLWVHLYDPHLPYDAPEPFRGEYEGRPYDAEVGYSDRCIGTLLARLDADGLSRRPTIIAVGDHGEGLGDHGELSHGVLLYDTTIRVPLLIRPAGGASTTTVIDRPVSIAQVGPTLLAIAGLPNQGVLPGLLDEGPSDPVPAETLYTAQQLGWSPAYAGRIGHFKVIDAPQPELYDVRTDPHERQDLAAADPDTLVRLRAVLRRELEAAAQRALQPSAAPLDADASRQLAALGYVSGGGSVIGGVAPVGGVDPKARLDVWQQVERGLELAQAGRHAEATAAFEAALRDDPGNVLALKFLGAASLERGDLAGAIKYNERVVESGLHLADALSNLVLAYYGAGRLNEAIASGRRAMQADAGHRAARENLTLVLQAMGTARARAGDASGAIDALEEAAALDPSNVEVTERLGAVLHRAGRVEEARSRFEAVVAAAPDRPAPQLSLAILDLESGRPREAAARLQQIRQDWAGAYQAQFYLGEAYRQTGDRARAYDAYAACLAAAPTGDPIVPAARRALAAVR